MNHSKIGDIVRLKMLGELHYYIVTDTIDLTTESDEMPYVECEVMLIFPIQTNKRVEAEVIMQNELDVIAEVGTKKHDFIMTYIDKERRKLGLNQLPEYIRRIGSISGAEKYATKVNGRKTEEERLQNIVMSDKDIEKILKDKHSDIKMEEFIGRMNIHLDLLFEALEKEDKEMVDLQKQQLEKVRKELVDLEYFSFKNQ